MAAEGGQERRVATTEDARESTEEAWIDFPVTTGGVLIEQAPPYLILAKIRAHGLEEVFDLQVDDAELDGDRIEEVADDTDIVESEEEGLALATGMETFIRDVVVERIIEPEVAYWGTKPADLEGDGPELDVSELPMEDLRALITGTMGMGEVDMESFQG